MNPERRTLADDLDRLTTAVVELRDALIAATGLDRLAHWITRKVTR
jgi:hypothetical protein